MDAEDRVVGMMEAKERLDQLYKGWDQEKIRRRVNNVERMLDQNIELMQLLETEDHSVSAEGVALIGQVLDREARRKLQFVHLANDG